MFSKSTFSVTETELKCCHRIIELCKDCVLIVYQYAFEQKPLENDTKSAASASDTSHLDRASTPSLSLSKFKSNSTLTLSALKQKSK